MDQPKISAHLRRQIAVAANCDPKTVARRLKGEPVQPSIAARIDSAASALGAAPQPSAP